jgi:AraC family transcriptional regulator, regulatory protein of adaptative response / DNA-3-methyladenine glycosylase II
MQLDPAICARARKTHDPRFDGRFFIGVLTTRIYCRPVCPVRSPKEENVRYFATAAAASEAGLRPCLRCRPESSPGTPAWLGTSATVSRALRLIGESALEDGGVENLAQRLGIGSRHLRRLFLEHLGASPIAVAQTRRLHFAKRLLDETNLPMNELALAAGFGSVRRFNDTFCKTYSRTPTQLRRFARRTGRSPQNEYRFVLRYRPPFDWNALLAFLEPRATPGVESVVGGKYQRTIALNGHSGFLEVSHDNRAGALEVQIRFPEPRWLFLIIERVRRMFDLNADPEQIASHLRGDPMLAARLARRPGLRVPGCWDGFELAVRAILGQQVTVKGATTLAGRLVRAYGTALPPGDGLTHLFPSADALASADFATVGLPRARAESIRALASAVRDGEITFSNSVDLDDFERRLCALPGIGAWTAHYIAMRALGEPDAFPAADLGLLRATSMKDVRRLRERAEKWRPWRAYAAMYLWQVDLSKARQRVSHKPSSKVLGPFRPADSVGATANLRDGHAAR